MPRKRFDKKSAKTFSVVHRAHDDKYFFDNDASKHVLVPAPGKQLQELPKKKIYTTQDIENLASEELEGIRNNEGLAAQYGIYYDDSRYDYMQHLKPMGNTDGVFIGVNEEDKSKKESIEELFKDQLPSKEKVKITHDTFQAIPKELKGFNPDLDPKLREVLEALEDEAYIEQADENEEDIFDSLLKSGEAEYDDFEGSEGEYSDEYDEWDLDNYEDEYNEKYDSDQYQELENPYNEGEAPPEAKVDAFSKINNAWERDFKKFEALNKTQPNEWDSDEDFEEEEADEVFELPDINDTNKKLSKTKLRKKKGAMTDTSSFSMSSSAVYRTEGLTLLDDRYEQYAKKFEKEDNTTVPEKFEMENERQDFEDMLDDFLDNYELESGGRKLVKKDAEKTKLQEAADSVSKSKVAARRKKNKSVNKLGNTFGNMKI